MTNAELVPPNPKLLLSTVSMSIPTVWATILSFSEYSSDSQSWRSEPRNDSASSRCYTQSRKLLRMLGKHDFQSLIKGMVEASNRIFRAYSDWPVFSCKVIPSRLSRNKSKIPHFTISLETWKFIDPQAMNQPFAEPHEPTATLGYLCRVLIGTSSYSVN